MVTAPSTDGDDLIGGPDTVYNDVVSIYGGLGNDTIEGAAVGGGFYGGDGDDLIISRNPAASGLPLSTLELWGEGGNDTIDVSGGYAGNSIRLSLSGGDGDDRIILGSGAYSIISGGSGWDVLSLKGFLPYVFVFSGYPYVSSGTLTLSDMYQIYFDTFERIEFTPGDDQIIFTQSFVGWSIGGMDGNDRIFASYFADTIDGGDGNDSIEASDGADSISGDAGDDTLSGGYGVDSLFGGLGNDVLRAEFDGDSLDGGDGWDVADYTNVDFLPYPSGVWVSLTGLMPDYWTTDHLVNIEEVIGTSFADTILGDDGVNVLTGRKGEDSLVGNGGDDSLYGGDGWDTLHGGQGKDRLDGGAGLDSLFGGDDGDLLLGGAGADELSGDGGADRLFGGAGADALFGGAGDDVLVGGAGADLLDGGDGVDVANYSASRQGIYIDLSTGFTIGGDAAEDRLVSIEGVIGSARADHLSGDAGANLLSGGGGGDRLYGGAGDDVIRGGAGADTMDGGEGRDRADFSDASAGVQADLANGTAISGQETDVLSGFEDLFGSRYDDSLNGDTGKNLLSGGTGADTLSGGGGADTLIGGTGDDRLVGGAGADLLRGGAGADVFVFNGTGDSGTTPATMDRIADFNAAEGDRIDLAGIGSLNSFSQGGFTGVAGEVTVVAAGASWRVMVDLDGDMTADFALRVVSATPPELDSFSLFS